MSGDYEQQLRDLIQRSYMMDGTAAEVELLEEAIRLADSHNDLERAFQLRVNLIQAATFNGFPEKVLVAFTWCLAQCDARPDLGDERTFDERRLLWQSKWAMHTLPEFPHISRAQFDAVTADMAARYQRAGASQRPIHKLRCTSALEFRDPDAARAEFPLWQQAKHDWNSDCRACDADSLVDYHASLGEDEAALKAARPILRGKLQCAEVPHVTYALLLAPLVRLGMLEEAAECHRHGYKLVAGNRELLRSIARHIEFLIQTDNRTRAVTAFQKHLGFALDSSPIRQLEFYLASLFLIERLRRSGRVATRKLRLPAEFPLHREDGTYRLDDLADWFRGRCEDLAGRFDRRNGNDGYRRLLDAIPGRLDGLTPHPLSVPKDKGEDGPEQADN